MTVVRSHYIALHSSYTVLASVIFTVLLLTVFVTNIAAQDIKVVSPEKVGLSAERLARLDKFMQEEINQKRHGGIIALIARHGSIVYHKAFGMADIESGKKMQTDHIFPIASMTKPVTSAALLMLYEEGKFQLTDPLENYIPAFRGVKVFAVFDDEGRMKYEEPKRKITIQDVFRHTAGFVYSLWGDPPTPVHRAYQEAGVNMYTVDSLKELVDKLATMPLLHHPGEQWIYSYAHDVQAYLVEYFSGMPFDEYVERKIFQSLGMKDTFFGIPREYFSRYTTIYGPAEGGGLQATEKPGNSIYMRFLDHPMGGSGLSSTVMDYYLFSQMLLNGGKLGDIRLLGRKTVESMTSNHLPPNIEEIGGGVGYGLGVSVLKNPMRAGILGSKGQYGWMGGFGTYVNIDPEEEIICLIFANALQHWLSGPFRTLVYQAIVD